MSNLVGRKVQMVRMHAPIHAPNVKGLGTLNTVTSDTAGAKGGTELTYTDSGVYIYVKASRTEILVPWGNIVNIVFAPDKAQASE